MQALHGDDDGGGLALGPEPADVVAGNQAGELLDALVDLASFPLIEVLAAERVGLGNTIQDGDLRFRSTAPGWSGGDVVLVGQSTEDLFPADPVLGEVD